MSPQSANSEEAKRPLLSARDDNDASAPDPCTEANADCPSIGPTPATEFLRQALGSNYGDVRLPSLLLVSAALLAVIVQVFRRRSRRAADRMTSQEEDLEPLELPELPGSRTPSADSPSASSHDEEST